MTNTKVNISTKTNVFYQRKTRFIIYVIRNHPNVSMKKSNFLKCMSSHESTEL